MSMPPASNQESAARRRGSWFWDFGESEELSVESAGEVFGAFGEGDVDVGETHGVRSRLMRIISYDA